MNSSLKTADLNINDRPQSVTRALTLSSLLFSALLLLIVLTPVPYGTVERWWDSAFEIGIFLLAALALIDAVPSQNLLTSEHRRLLVPLLALTIYAILQLVPLWSQTTPLGVVRQPISSDPYETKLLAIKFLALTFWLAMLLRYTNTSRRLTLLVHAVIMIALASAIFGIVRQLYQFNAEGFLLPALKKGSGYAQFINRNHFAFLSEMAFGLIAGLIAGRGLAWPRPLIYVALALPLWTALVLSNSRGGLLAMTSQVVFFALVSDIGRTKQRDEKDLAPSAARRVAALAIRLVLIAALVVGIVVGMVLVGGEPLADRISITREELTAQPTEKTHSDRASIWKATLRLCYDHPMTGAGFGGYWVAITRYHDGSGELVPQQAHNDYLELWASGGLIGVALFLWFVAIFARQAHKQLKSPDRFRRAVTLGALTGVFGIAVHSLVDFGLHLTGNAIICMALITLATRQFESSPSASDRSHT
jgi:O-antigen ligase